MKDIEIKLQDNFSPVVEAMIKTTERLSQQLRALDGGLNNTVKAQNAAAGATRNVTKAISSLGQNANRTLKGTSEQAERLNSTLQRTSKTDPLRQTIQSTRTATASLRQYNAELNKTHARMAQGPSGGDTGGLGAEAVLGKLKGLGLALGGTMAAKSAVTYAVKLSDTYASINARLRNMVRGQETVEELQGKIFDLAQRSRGSYQGIADTLGKMSSMAGEAFTSNDQMLAFAETVQKSFSIVGTDQGGQEAFLLQMNQFLAGGVLRAEEFNSMMEQSPQLMKMVAQSLGMTTAEMKEAGISSTDFIKGVLSNMEQVDQQFNAMPKTWGQVWQNFKNTFEQAMGPILERISNLLNSEHFQTFMGSVSKLVAFLLNAVVYIVDITSQGVSFLSDLWAEHAEGIMNIIRPTVAYTAGALAWIGAVVWDTAVVIWNITIQLIEWIGNGVSYLVTTVINRIMAILQFFEPFVSFMLQLWQSMVNMMLKFYQKLVVWVVNGFASIVDGTAWAVNAVGSLWVNMTNKMKLAFASIVNAVGQALNAVASTTGGVINNVLSGINAMINGAIGGLNKLIGMANKIPGVNIDSIGQVDLSVSMGNFGASMASYTPELSTWEGVNFSGDGLRGIGQAVDNWGGVQLDVADKLSAGIKNWTAKEAPRMDLSGLKGGLTNPNDAYRTAKAWGEGLFDGGKKAGQKGSPYGKGIFDFNPGAVGGLSPDAPGAGSGGSGGKGGRGGGKNPDGGHIDSIGRIDSEVQISDEYLRIVKDYTNFTAQKTIGTMGNITLNPVFNIDGFNGTASEAQDWSQMLANELRRATQNTTDLVYG